MVCVPPAPSGDEIDFWKIICKEKLLKAVS